MDGPPAIMLNDNGGPKGDARVYAPHMSPGSDITKSFSSTNLPGTPSLKRPSLETRSRSSASTMSGMGVPKTPTKAVKKASSKSPRVDSGKTLVDQFFTVNKEAPTPSTKRHFDDRRTSGSSNTDVQSLDEFPGQLVYEPVDGGVTSDPDLTNYLLNIDALTRDLLKQDPDATTSLTPLNNTMDALVRTIGERNRESLLAAPSATLSDLQTAVQRLAAVKQSIAAFCTELHTSHHDLKSKYRAHINTSVDKLNELLFTLDKLESRFNKTRNRINDNKKVIAEQILQKIEVLEYVDSKFAEHSRANRKKRFKQLYITLGVVVVVASIYCGAYGFI